MSISYLPISAIQPFFQFKHKNVLRSDFIQFRRNFSPELDSKYFQEIFEQTWFSNQKHSIVTWLLIANKSYGDH